MMNARWGLLVGAVGWLVACSDSGSDAPPLTSQPASGVYVGQVLDGRGQPVAGALVSVEGVSSAVETGPDGRFVVSESSLAGVGSAVSPVVAASQVGTSQVGASQVGTSASAAGGAVALRVSVEAAGVEAGESLVRFEAGEVPTVRVVREALSPRVVVASPQPEAVFEVPLRCPSPEVEVRGQASLEPLGGLEIDLCVVLDRSASTDRAVSYDVRAPGGGQLPDTVLGAEVAAALCMVESLDLSFVRVALVGFADNGRTATLSGFTRDRAALEAALLGAAQQSEGGTDFQEAFDEARALFQDVSLSDPLEGDGGQARPAPLKRVVFLSDGIPTAPVGSNLSQESGDREAALQGARDLAAAGVIVDGFAIRSTRSSERTLTTLPACAAITGGQFQDVRSSEALAEALCGASLTDVLEVRVRNLDVLGSERVASLSPDGTFSARLPVSLLGGGDVENRVEVEVYALDGQQSEVYASTVRLVSGAVLSGQGFDAVSGPLVSQVGVRLPEGGALGNNSLRSLLGTQFPDARQLFGGEALTVPGSGNVTLQFDLVNEAGGFGSDFGYFTFDPAAPPESPRQALTTAVVLFDSSGFSPAGGRVPDGDVRVTASVPAGRGVGLFVVPNGRLAAAQAGTSRNAPLFSLSALNPGGAPQALVFASASGRVGSTPREVTVLAFEDLALAGRGRSDRDYNDLVWTVDVVDTDLPEACSP